MSQAVASITSKVRDVLFHLAGFLISLLLMSLPAVAGQVTLAWDPVLNSALAGYVLHYGPSAGQYTSKIDVGKTTLRTVSNLTEGATYHFAVTAYGASRVETGFSNDVSATIPYGALVAGFTASATSGTAPLAMNFINTSTGSISTYSWNFGDGTMSTSKSPSHVYSAAGVYSVSLTVTGPAGNNTKTIANYVTVKAQGSLDTSPPIAPTSLVASASGTSSVQLTWKASTDNVGVTGYRIERCQGVSCTAFAQIATSTVTTFSSTGLLAGTRYSYRVRATDAAGHVSAYSNTATATTTATADTSPPVAPTSLIATASGNTSISLSWKASTDNVGVTGYRIERCQGVSCTAFAQIATSTVTTFSSTGLLAGTRYSYRVRATDAAGRLSAYSNTATATTTTTADTSPPTAPMSLVATASGNTSISLSWKASTDNVRVTGYRIERCQGVSCTAFAHIATSTGTVFNNTGLLSGTRYSYRVRAIDSTDHFSAYSNTATATTTTSVTGSLTADWVLVSNEVDPASVGSSDWARWSEYIRRANGGRRSDFAMQGRRIRRSGPKQVISAAT